MAYNNSYMKAKGGGSGRISSVFTYATTDDKATIQAENYFGEAGSFLSLGDLVYISFIESTLPYVVSAVNNVEGGGFLVNVQAYDLFVGDGRATDIAGGRNESLSMVLQGASGLFTFYAYSNNTDTKAIQAASGYFADGGGVFRIGDIISCIATDGHQFLRVLTTGATVTTEAIILA